MTNVENDTQRRFRALDNCAESSRAAYGGTTYARPWPVLRILAKSLMFKCVSALDNGTDAGQSLCSRSRTGDCSCRIVAWRPPLPCQL